ncbi:MAG: hypothetical protein AAB925_01370 [Patescibacteria group bacterium]
MKKKIFIRNISVIIIILTVVFLSQQPHFGEIGKNLYDQGAAYISGHWEKASDWLEGNVYHRVSSEAVKRGEAIKSEVNQEKQKVSENLGKKIKDYFSGVVDSVFNPDKNNNSQSNNQNSQTCQPAN